MNGLRNAIVMTALLMLIGCGPAVDESSLPAVPQVNVAGYQPAVREQLKTAHKLFERKPLHAGANGELGMLYRAYRDFDAADALFARARALAPRDPDWSYYHAEVLEQKAQYAPALSALHDFLQREPRDLAGRLRAARLQTSLNNIDAALEALAPLYAEAPQVGDVHVAYAQALTRAGRTDDAVKIWETAIEQVGQFKVAHYALAQLYRRRGDDAAAEQQLWLFNTVGAEEPPVYDPRLAELFRLNRSDRALVLAAQAAKREGDAKRALELLEKALERFPDNLETRASLIMGYAAESDFASVERHIEEGLAIDAQHLELGLAIARVRLQQGKLNDARSRLLGLTERSPKHAASRAWLGRVFELSGATADADRVYAEAFAIDPQSLVTRRFYARWVLARNDPQAAAEVLEAMVRAPARDEPIILGTLAQVLLKLDRRDDAVDALERGIDRAKWLGQARLVARLENQRAALQIVTP
ncbi:MAG: tetratricopeptide repeat protein [Gammaproteobacteria bacterium]